VVHGGEHHEPSVADDELVAEIERLDVLAPLHNAVAAAAIRDLRERLPGVPHVACFDTAFHATLPRSARTYALPSEWVERFGIRRYGFHGLSVRWATERAGVLLGRDPGDCTWSWRTSGRARRSRPCVMARRSQRRWA
jgi:acetate kinase